MFSRLDTAPASYGRRTDGQTPHDRKYRAMQSVGRVTRSSADADKLAWRV